MATIDIRGATLSAADPPIATNPSPDLAIKAPARVATTGSNITLSGLQTLDGVTLAAGDRVLVKDQTDQTTNGLYNATTGPWTRTIDAASNSQWAKGLQVAVTDGSANSGTNWRCTATSPITLGTTSLTFTQSTNPVSALVMPGKTVLGNSGSSPATAQNLNWPVTTGGAQSQIIVKNSATAGDASWYDDLWLNIEAFGGKGDNTTDNTTPLNNALAALTGTGGGIFFPAGKYKFNSAITYNLPGGIFSVTLVGAGQDAAVLTWPSGSGGLTFNYAGISSSVHIRDLSLTTGTTAGGNAINLQLATSLANPALTAISDIFRVTIRGDDGYEQTDYWTAGINVGNVSNIQIEDVSIFGASSPSGIGIKLIGLPGSSTYGVVYNISQATFVGLATGIQYGSFIQGVTVSESNFTGNLTGISIPAAQSGVLSQLAITNSQFNCSTAGINVASNLGQFALTNSLVIVSSNSTGVNLQSFNNAQIIGCQFGGLSLVNSTGLSLGTPASGSVATVNASLFYGLNVGLQLTASEFGAMVDGNYFNNNNTHILNSSTASSNVITNNPAFNPVGPSGITVGGSPFTYTASPSPETIYLRSAGAAGTITDIKVNGLTVASSYGGTTGVPLTFELGPNETVTVTYNTTTPIMAKMVH